LRIGEVVRNRNTDRKEEVASEGEHRDDKGKVEAEDRLIEVELNDCSAVKREG